MSAQYGADGTHAHGRDENYVTAQTRRVLASIAIVLALLTAGALVLLLPDSPAPSSRELGQLFDGRIEAIERQSCPGAESDPNAPDCVFGKVRMLAGPDEGSVVAIEIPTGSGSIAVGVDDRIVLSYYDNPEAVAADVRYQLADRDRKPALLWLALAFALAVIVLGRLRGLAALAALGATLVILVGFVMPAILAGRSPLLVAVVGAAAIAYVALYASHGFGTKTTVALLGTLASLGLAAGIGTLFTALTQLTGRASEDATVLSVVGPQVDFVGIFLAGLIIGALGAIDDVTVTQASAVWELRAANERLSRRDLLRAAMRVGRDHVGSTVNTLVLAYAGSSMTLLLLFALADQNLAQIANGEVVAVEIVRALAGSIALVASVPITSWLASRAVAAPVESPESPVEPDAVSGEGLRA